MKKSQFFAIFVFFALAGVLFGAEITVSHLELATRGAMVDGKFGIGSSMETDISVSGGYKYDFTLGLGAEIPNLEKALSYGRMQLQSTANSNPTDDEYNDMVDELNDRYNNQAVISIRSIRATVREVFDTPLDICFFIGEYDKLGSGEEFQHYFGTDPIGTGLKGFFYYPEGLNGDPFLRFNGAIHNIRGTGLALKLFYGNIIPALYIYQDLSFPQSQSPLGGGKEPNRFSGDMRVLFNSEHAKLEVFYGGTFPNPDYGDPVLRAGALAWFGSGPLSFLMQAGIPAWEMNSESDFNIDHCYFLLEPRFRAEKIGATLTFFYHPVYYMNQVIEENGKKAKGQADINLRLFYGDVTKTPFEAGIETTVGLKFHDGQEYKVWVSPFISTITAGLRWDIALRFNARYFKDKKNLMEFFLGIQTAF